MHSECAVILRKRMADVERIFFHTDMVKQCRAQRRLCVLYQ